MNRLDGNSVIVQLAFGCRQGALVCSWLVCFAFASGCSPASDSVAENATKQNSQSGAQKVLQDSTEKVSESTYRWQAISQATGVVATLQPLIGPPRIGAYQRWQLRLETGAGVGLANARPQLNGGMRAHGHGLPSRPAVSEQDQAGDYLVEGVKLNMAGEWSFIVDFYSGTSVGASVADRVSFELRIETIAGRVTDRELAIFKTLSLSTLPLAEPNPSNQVATSVAAAALGEIVFFDPGFSRTGEVSCASCHQPDSYFTDGLATGVGVGKTTRNTPTIVGSGYLEWFYWDGRRDSLWSQALIPFEAAAEMGSARTAVVRRVVNQRSLYAAYVAAFGELPMADWYSGLANAGPFGDRAAKARWRRLSNVERERVNTVFANVGKAVAAYERTLLPQPTRFDRFVSALEAPGEPLQSALLSKQELAGARLFIDSEKTACMQCHNGPLLTNGGFHNVGTGNFGGANLDFGRSLGLQAMLLDEFNCYGDYSDAKPTQCTGLRFLNTDAHVPLEGAFKTPSLRELGRTAPYFHDGSKATLAAVLEHYRTPPEGAPHELKPLNLTDKELAQLESFLMVLSESS